MRKFILATRNTPSGRTISTEYIRARNYYSGSKKCLTTIIALRLSPLPYLPLE